MPLNINPLGLGGFTRTSQLMGQPSTSRIGMPTSNAAIPMQVWREQPTIGGQTSGGGFGIPTIPGLPGGGGPSRQTGIEPLTTAAIIGGTKDIWAPIVQTGLEKFGNWLLPGSPFGEKTPSGVELGAVPAVPPGQTGGLGLPQGPGGGLQLPWNDPSTPSALKAFALDDSFLKLQYRSPKGYVTVRDAAGRPYPLLKTIAQKMGLWKPKRKPPISVRDWSAYRRAGAVEKKLRKIAAKAMPRRKAPFCGPQKTICRTRK